MRLLPLICLALTLTVQAQDKPYDRIFFENSRMSGPYFYSKTEYSGNSWVLNTRNRLPVNDTIFFTPGNSLQLKYHSAPQGKWRASIQYPEWRGKDNFKQSFTLEFRLTMRETGTVNSLPTVRLMSSDSLFSKPIALGTVIRSIEKNKWIRVSIPLRNLGFDTLKPERIAAVIFEQGNELAAGDLYIDQIELGGLQPTTAYQTIPRLLDARGYERHVDISWAPVIDGAVRYIKIYRSTNNRDFRAVGLISSDMMRYADYTGQPGRTFYYRISALDLGYNETALSNTISASTAPMTDDKLLTMMQEAHFRYYWEGAEQKSGLALENIPGRNTMVASGASGFGIMALLVGTERNFITRQQSIERFQKILSFLEKTDKFHGAFSHFIDGISGKAVPYFGPDDNGGDLVETSFLMQGLLTARQFFSRDNLEEKQIRDRITMLWRQVEWNWYKRSPDNPFLFWHWSREHEWKLNHKLIGFNETMITYLLAIASPSFPIEASSYYNGFASQSPEAQQYRKGWGNTDAGSMYSNGNHYYGIQLPVGVSSGGPIFFLHYSYFGMDPRGLKDKYTDYFENNRRIALINHRYCSENPENHEGYGERVWGLTGCDGPFGYRGHEPSPGGDDGTIAPTGAVSSMPYTPSLSIESMKYYYRTYGRFLWGEYGFRDAFNLDENWCAEIYMGLNQAPITIMIENYRTGLIWKLFMSNPEIQEMKRKVFSP